MLRKAARRENIARQSPFNPEVPPEAALGDFPYFHVPDPIKRERESFIGYFLFGFGVAFLFIMFAAATWFWTELFGFYVPRL